MNDKSLERPCVGSRQRLDLKKYFFLHIFKSKIKYVEEKSKYGIEIRQEMSM